jgi:guanylate kinase
MVKSISKDKTRGSLLVISGPSGVGKGTILKPVLEQDRNLFFSVSATTRAPRPGETDGIDYFFTEKSQFEIMIEQGKFLEWAKVHENYYGTLSDFVDKKLDEGLDVILDIDVQGAFQVMEKRPDEIFIFIAPPKLDIEVLRERLLKRNTESRESMEIRLKNAEWELTTFSKYEYIVFNDKAEDAAKDLQAIIRAERCRTKKLTINAV